MNDLLKLSSEIWANSIEIEFGSTEIWVDNSLTKKWFEDNLYSTFWPGQSPGWYWLSVDLTYSELHSLTRPSTLPNSGCDFGLLTHQNTDTFGSHLLCKHSENRVVIYNGHEGNVASRIRTHFNLNNNSTGALGIRHYPLSNKIWKVNFFSRFQIAKLPTASRDLVEKLINDKSGRTAIENAWRMKNGWPVLCKE